MLYNYNILKFILWPHAANIDLIKKKTIKLKAVLDQTTKRASLRVTETQLLIS